MFSFLLMFEVPNELFGSISLFLSRIANTARMALPPLDKSLVMLPASDDISSEKKYKNARQRCYEVVNPSVMSSNHTSMLV